MDETESDVRSALQMNVIREQSGKEEKKKPPFITVMTGVLDAAATSI